MSVRSSIAVLGVVAVVGLLVYGLASKGTSGLEVGDPVPVRALPRLEGGGEASLAEYRGRWVLVNIWASWCPPCRQETPALAEFQQRHGGPKFTVLGIDTRDLSDDGQAFVVSYGLDYPQLRDGNGEAADEYGTSGVPESFLIDPAGKVRLHVAGPIGEEELRDEVAPLLPKAKS
ncbi:MAG TPA: TlpA disulfide reductase family protein [Solirubrobacterales bacterium]|nr:TlpA disulfide reductase family protein [Solirubrobacterales bacterium]